jgi:hypothetical protein
MCLLACACIIVCTACHCTQNFHAIIANGCCALGCTLLQWAANEAKFGAFSVWPAAGCLPGRGLHLPRTQVIQEVVCRVRAACFYKEMSPAAA